MKCNEKGCTARVDVYLAFVPSLGKIALAEGKNIASLIFEDLEKHAICDDCARLHLRVEGTRMFRFEAALEQLRREKGFAERQARRDAAETARQKRQVLVAKFGTTATATIGDLLRATRQRQIESAFGA